MKSKLHNSGTFFLFGLVGLLGFIFVFIFFKESKGLSDKEVKELYVPDHLRQ